MVYLDLTSLSPDLRPLRNVTGITMVSPYSGRRTSAALPSCGAELQYPIVNFTNSTNSTIIINRDFYDQVLKCFVETFALIPVPEMFTPTPVISDNKFSEPVFVAFRLRTFYEWQTDFFNEFLGTPDTHFISTVYDRSGDQVFFFDDRYVSLYRADLYLRTVEGDDINDDSAYELLPQFSLDWNLVPVLPLGVLDIAEVWSNLTLMHGRAYQIRIEVTIEDQFRYHSRFVIPEEVRNPDEVGKARVLLRSSDFYRQPCPPQLLAVANTTECVKCPTNSVCNGSTEVKGAVDKHLWRPREHLLPFASCDLGSEGCVPGSNGTVCNEGYEGPLCGVCSEGYGQYGGQCVECPARAISIALVTLMATFQFGYTAWVVACTVWDNPRPSRPRFPLFNLLLSRSDVPLKIVFNHMALMGIVSSTALAKQITNERIGNILSLQYILGNIAIYDVLSVECMFSDFNASHKFIVSAGVIVLLIIFFLAACRIASCVEHLKQRTTWRHEDVAAFSAQNEDLGEKLTTSPQQLKDVSCEQQNGQRTTEECDMPCSMHDRKSAMVGSGCLAIPMLSVLVAVLRIIHPSLIGYSAALIPCNKYEFFNIKTWTTQPAGVSLPPPDATVFVLASDRSISCESFKHWIAVGWVVLIVVGIGIPAFCAGVFALVKKLRGEERTLKAFDFLVGNFRPMTWYWESALMVREVVGFLILSVLTDSSFQLVALNAFFIAWISLHSRSVPYLTDALNRAEYFSVGAAFVTLNLLSVLETYEGKAEAAEQTNRLDLKADANRASDAVVLTIFAFQGASLVVVIVSAGLYVLQEARTTLLEERKVWENQEWTELEAFAETQPQPNRPNEQTSDRIQTTE